MNTEIKCHKNQQSHIQKLKIRAVLKFQSTLVELQHDTEANFMARFIDQEMAIYNGGKEHQRAKLELKFVVASYVSMVNDYVCILCEFKSNV